MQGEWCKANVNPYKIPLLKHNKANLSVCEQRFSWMKHFKYSFRYMNKQRFNFMLLVVCWLDRKYRLQRDSKAARVAALQMK